jgi:hypothetical protein
MVRSKGWVQISKLSFFLRKRGKEGNPKLLSICFYCSVKINIYIEIGLNINRCVHIKEFRRFKSQKRPEICPTSSGQSRQIKDRKEKQSRKNLCQSINNNISHITLLSD